MLAPLDESRGSLAADERSLPQSGPALAVELGAFLGLAGGTSVAVAGLQGAGVRAAGRRGSASTILLPQRHYPDVRFLGCRRELRETETTASRTGRAPHAGATSGGFSLAAARCRP
jgi:hypothetical protein